MLHEFVHHGKRISQLLEQQWYGYLAVTKVVYDNYITILQLWKKLKMADSMVMMSPRVSALKGYVDLEFRMTVVAASKFLSMLQPEDAALQTWSWKMASFNDYKMCWRWNYKLRSNQKYNPTLEEAKSLTSFWKLTIIGCGTAVCEFTFSTLTVINRPQRLSRENGWYGGSGLWRKENNISWSERCSSKFLTTWRIIEFSCFKYFYYYVNFYYKFAEIMYNLNGIFSRIFTCITPPNN